MSRLLIYLSGYIVLGLLVFQLVRWTVASRADTPTPSGDWCRECGDRLDATARRQHHCRCGAPIA